MTKLENDVHIRQLLTLASEIRKQYRFRAIRKQCEQIYETAEPSNAHTKLAHMKRLVHEHNAAKWAVPR